MSRSPISVNITSGEVSSHVLKAPKSLAIKQVIFQYVHDRLVAAGIPMHTQALSPPVAATGTLTWWEHPTGDMTYSWVADEDEDEAEDDLI